MMMPIVEELKGELAGKIDVKTVDTSEDRDLALQFSVMSIPTFILLKDGEEIDRKMGAMAKEEMLSWLQSYL